MAKQRKRSRALTKRQLRQKYTVIRKELRILQKQGLISERANINANKPSLALRKKALSLRSVVTGAEQAIRVPRSKAKEYADAGYRVIGNRVLVKSNPYEKLKYSPSSYVHGRYMVKDYITGAQPPGSPTEYLERIILPLRLDNFVVFNEWLQRDPGRLQAMIPPGAMIGFTFFGYRSREVGDAWWLAEYLLHYGAFTDPEHEDANEAFASLELWAFKGLVWEAGFDEESRFEPKTRKSRRNRVNATGRNYTSAAKGSSVAKTSNERKVAYRERLKQDPKAYRTHKFEEAARLKAYRIKKKNEAAQRPGDTTA